jgi:hypothetical protein
MSSKIMQIIPKLLVMSGGGGLTKAGKMLLIALIGSLSIVT